MIGRRKALLGLPLALGGCGLSERPYAEQRQWPLVAYRPSALPAPSRGLVLEVRGMRAAAGLEVRGLQSLLPDGSIRTAFYEQWAVPPPQGVEESLRLWLAQSGLFAAVVSQGSRSNADVSLESTLSALWTTPDGAVATVTVVLIDLRTPARRVMLQRSVSGRAPVGSGGEVPAQIAAVADVLGQIEAVLAGAAV